MNNEILREKKDQNIVPLPVEANAETYSRDEKWSKCRLLVVMSGNTIMEQLATAVHEIALGSARSIVSLQKRLLSSQHLGTCHLSIWGFDWRAGRNPSQFALATLGSKAIFLSPLHT